MDKRFFLLAFALIVGTLVVNSDATISRTYYFDQPAVSSPVQDLNGLSAKAIFTLNNPTELQIELFNISTGLPDAWGSGANDNQILTAVSFDTGHPGHNGDPQIISGSVAIGPGGRSIDFDQISSQLGEYDDVSGEWGYGNMDGTGLLANFVSCTSAQSTRFVGDNLDSADNIDGPQGGIVTDGPRVPLGGLGAVADSVIITLIFNYGLDDLDFLDENGVMVEFGSDAAFLVPEPATVLLLGFGALLLKKRN